MPGRALVDGNNAAGNDRRSDRLKEQDATRAGFRELERGKPPAGRKEGQPGRHFEQRPVDHEPHTGQGPHRQLSKATPLRPLLRRKTVKG
jgi:hypothetical protein